MPPAPHEDPVVWALVVIISSLVGTLALFIKAVLKERDYWRQAFFEEQAQKREMMITGQVVRNVVRNALPESDGDPPPGGGSA